MWSIDDDVYYFAETLLGAFAADIFDCSIIRILWYFEALLNISTDFTPCEENRTLPLLTLYLYLCESCCATTQNLNLRKIKNIWITLS